MERNPLYIEYLISELDRRSSKNSSYSLRAFARDLNINDGALSQILSSKRIPSMQTAERIANLLDLKASDRKGFFASLANVQRGRALRRINLSFIGLDGHEAREPIDLSLDVFRAISDWYPVAILELTFVKGFRPEISWIARTLGITQVQARIAVDRLLKLGMLERRGGTLVKTEEKLTTREKHLTAPAFKRFQKQTLERAVQSLEKDPIERRNMMGITMAIDPAKLSEARRMISAFNQSLSAFLSDGDRTEVYQFSSALYPLQKKEKKT